MVKRMKVKILAASRGSKQLIKIGKLFLIVMILGNTVGTGSVWARSKKAAPSSSASVSTPPQVPLSTEEILKKSQISYIADGGFTAVRSYSVIISCAGGKISTLCSIIDPRITKSESKPIYRKGSMDIEDYLAMWKKLNNLAVFQKKDAPLPKHDILDEFTMNFSAQVGMQKNSFKVVGITRPEGYQYQAIKSILDKSSQMGMLWDFHKSLASKSSLVRNVE